MNPTKKILDSMLKENTGTHFLDSGGTYGRVWEKTQGKNFEDDKEESLRLERNGKNKLGIEVTFSTYHFLAKTLEYAPKLQKEFDRLSKRQENLSQDWCFLIEEFCKLKIWKIKGRENTYNFDNFLDRVLLYTVIENEEGEKYIFLQLHGGCDVRGGYTAPKIFKILEDGNTRFWDMSTASISCTKDRNHNWLYAGEGEWWVDGGSVGKHLEDYEAVEDSKERGKGKVYISKNDFLDTFSAA